MNLFQKIARRGKDVAFRRSTTEVLIRDMTNNEQWGPTGTDLRRIAYLTYSPSAYDEIMNVLWQRVEDNGKNWRHIYKALLVIDFLLKNGCDRVIRQVQCNQVIIKTLAYFSFMEDDEDVGYAIRQRASKIIELLQDQKKLAEERELAARNREKFSQAMYTNKNQMLDRQKMTQNYVQEYYDYPGSRLFLGQKFNNERPNNQNNLYDNITNSFRSDEYRGDREIEQDNPEHTKNQIGVLIEDDAARDVQKTSQETTKVQNIFDELLYVNKTPTQTTSGNTQQMVSNPGMISVTNPGFRGLSQNVNAENYKNDNFSNIDRSDLQPNPFFQPPTSSVQNRFYQSSLQYMQMPISYQLDPSGYSDFQSSTSTTDNASFFNRISPLNESRDQYTFSNAPPVQQDPVNKPMTSSVMPSTEPFDPWKTSSIDLSFLNVKNESVKPDSSNAAQD